ncbi:TPA: lysophospholipid acyltransferase family protein, partial [Candidatus Galligastranaerophilus gallistercoris]|nr:lysophospholipid acyltransferase family protein [Candidatus Galligastranaerophilus gallistercoris]
MGKKLIDTIFPKTARTQLLAKLVTLYFEFKRHFYYCKNINYPENQCIFALWHAHQCGLYALKEREKTTVMISNSNDGEIIAQAGAAMGLNVVRGSHNRKGASATLELIDAIKKGNNGALTIDGPRGPKHKVKKGIIEIARMTGVPIVPMSWYSPSWFFLKFNTWDEFCFPLNCIKMKALYGNPIYIPFNASEE